MNFSLDSMYTLLLWMTCTQKQRNSYKAYFTNYIEIKLLDDIQKSYSHNKMNRMFENDNLKILFEFFVDNYKDDMLSNYKGVKRARYEAEIKEIQHNFRHYSKFMLIK